MNLYLASRYSRNAEMRGMRNYLEGIGHKVTSRWIDLHGGTAPTSAGADILTFQPESVVHYAAHDLEDIEKAEALISFTGNGGKGGRHAEFGYGLALGKLSVIVGPREHVFHTLPQVLHYPDVELFKVAVANRREGPLR